MNHPPSPESFDALELLARVLDERGVALCLFDADERVRYWNRSYLELFPEETDLLAPGLTYAATLRRFYEVNLPLAEQAQLEDYLAEGLRRHREQRGSYIYQRRDSRWIKAESFPTADRGLLKLWTDITRQGAGPDGWPELRDSFLSSEVSFALFDASGRFISANQAYRHLLPGDELPPGSTYREHLHALATQTLAPDAAEQCRSLLDREQPADQPQSGLVLARRDGGWLQLEERATSTGGLMCFWSDISASRAAQLHAATLQQRLSDAIESLAEGVALFDNQDRLLLCNTRYRELNALVADQVKPGVAWRDLTRIAMERGMFPEARGRETEWLDRRQQQRHQSGEPFDIALTNGQWVRYTDRRTRDGGTISVRFDITDLKRREVELHNSEQRFRTITESLPVLINTSREGRILYASPPAAELLRLSPEQLRQRDVQEFIVSPDDYQALIKQLRETGKLVDFELTVRRGDGSTFAAATTSQRIIYDGHNALVSTLTDLSQRKAAEAEIARQRDALHQAEKLSALGSLLAGVAHELNNPLAIVLGQAHQLEREISQPASLQRASRIRAAAERCARIVKNFLAMARQRPAERCPVDLNTLIGSALELTDYGLRANDIQVTRDLDPQLPLLQADPDQFNQLLLNLIVNAQQALMTRPVPRRLTLTTRCTGDPPMIELTVTDNGPGIPAEIRSRIFEPFFTTKPVGMGTGVGLSLCHGIVSAHDGEIQAMDAPDGGARIVIRLPPGTMTVAAVSAQPEEAPLPATDKRVLIIDDEPEIAELLAEILDRAGYHTTRAASGHQALGLLAAQSFDVIVSDLRMPDLDGPGLYRELCRHHPELSKRLLFVTGDSLGLPTLPTHDEVPVIEKPFAAEEIRRAVADLLARR